MLICHLHAVIWWTAQLIREKKFHLRRVFIIVSYFLPLIKYIWYVICCATSKDFQFSYLGTEYYLGKLGTECSASEIVSTYEECEVAATKLGRHMGSAFNITFRPAGCYYLYYKNSCYFNAANLSDTFNLLPDGGGVCKKGIYD